MHKFLDNIHANRQKSTVLNYLPEEIFNKSEKNANTPTMIICQNNIIYFQFTRWQFLFGFAEVLKYLVTFNFAWQRVCRCFSYVCNINMSISLGMVPFGGVESQEMLDYLLRGRRLAVKYFVFYNLYIFRL